MKEIIALKEYTDKYISLYEGEIRNINEPLAERLIEQGVVAEHNESGSGEGSGTQGGGMAIHELMDEQGLYLDKTWQEIYDSIMAGISPIILIVGNEGNFMYYNIINIIGIGSESNNYYMVKTTDENKRYVTNSSTGILRTMK